MFNSQMPDKAVGLQAVAAPARCSARERVSNMTATPTNFLPIFLGFLNLGVL